MNRLDLRPASGLSLLFNVLLLLYIFPNYLLLFLHCCLDASELSYTTTIMCGKTIHAARGCNVVQSIGVEDM